MNYHVVIVGMMLTGCSIGLKTTVEDTTEQTDSGDSRTLDSSDTPILDPVDRYRNEDTVTVTGLALPDDIVTLVIADDDGSYEYLAIADGDGSFTADIALTRGTDTQIEAANANGAAAPVVTQACAIWDAEEIREGLGEGYGDSCEDNPVVISEAFTDALSLKDTHGNALEEGDEDWFRVVTVDTTDIEESFRYEDYRFQAGFIAGDDKYALRVYRGSCQPDSEECAGEEYSEYSFSAEDIEPDEVGDVPDDPRACGGEPYNDCADFSETYYVVVRRTDGLLACSHYQLRIQNGNW
jgi:hypothetical protein